MTSPIYQFSEEEKDKAILARRERNLKLETLIKEFLEYKKRKKG